MGKTGHTLSDLAWRSSVLFNTSCSINGGQFQCFYGKTLPPSNKVLYIVLFTLFGVLSGSTQKYPILSNWNLVPGGLDWTDSSIRAVLTSLRESYRGGDISTVWLWGALIKTYFRHVRQSAQ